MKVKKLVAIVTFFIIILSILIPNIALAVNEVEEVNTSKNSINIESNNTTIKNEDKIQYDDEENEINKDDKNDDIDETKEVEEIEDTEDTNVVDNNTEVEEDKNEKNSINNNEEKEIKEDLGTYLVSYKAHVEEEGWQNVVKDGELAGTTGKQRRVEAIQIVLGNSAEILEGASIKYQVHVQDYGWMGWKKDGETAGTVKESKRIEAIQIELERLDGYSVLYRTHVQDIGWTDWVSDGEISGTVKQSKRIEAIQIKIVKKPEIVEPISMVKYSSHIETDGWEKSFSKIDGEMSGTTKQEKRLEAIQIALGNSIEIPKEASIKYQVHAQDYGWMNWKENGEIAGTIGEEKRLEAIKIEIEGLEGYSVVYRTHVQDYGWLDWVSNGEISGTVGKYKKIEAIEIKIVKTPKIEVNYTYNENTNTVTATISSDKQLSTISDKSWITGKDQMSYSKEYDVNDIYEVLVRDIDGIEVNLQINITQVIEPVSMVKYSSHIETDGWEKKYSKIDGDISGTTGESKRLEAIQISLGNSAEIPSGAKIKYQVHVQDYGWMDWKQSGEIAGTVKEGKRIEAIRINIEGMQGYCVEYRTHIGGTGWQKWKSDGEISGTIGEQKRIEAIQIKVVKEENKTIEPNVDYQAYVQNVGWQEKTVENLTAGTTGQSKRIEQLKINLNGTSNSSSIKYRIYTQSSWQDWVHNGQTVGETGKEIKAIQIELENLQTYSVEYRVYISDYGWQKWKKDGETAGVTENNNNIEAIQIRIVYNNSITLEPEVSYQAYVEEDGWKGVTPEGFTAGTEKESKRLEAIKIDLLDVDSSQRIKYRVHVQDIGWQSWVRNGAMAGTTRQSKRIEAIQIELENMNSYTIEYQVHIQDYGWSDWMIDGETAGTTGEGKRIEAIRIRIVPKYYRRYYGIDVSEHNGLIDWQSVKNSGVQFAMIRCAYRGYETGKIVTDKYFHYNMQNASAVGIKVGIYFFSQAISIAEAIEEANYTTSLAKQYNCITYPIAIDTEYSGAPNHSGRADGLGVALRTNVIAAFCNQISNAGYIPMVYASRDWLYNNLEITRLLSYETWLAHYTGNSLIESNYIYDYTMWQYTSSGSVPGIAGRVDLNIGYKRY